MARSIKIGNAILCDYVASGENNKKILLNVYSGDVLFVQFPPMVLMGLYIEYFLETDEVVPVAFEVRSNGSVMLEAGAEFGPPVGDQYGVFALQQFPLTLTSDTTLEVWLSAPGYRAVKALQKHVRKLSPDAFASATAQPVARSRIARKKKATSP
jgi:hypothetical protein